MSQRTITLTDRRPVKIDEDQWPVIASTSDIEHDGQIECQANRKSSWLIRVRQHADGRAIIYATYDHYAHWKGARNFSSRRGMLLDGELMLMEESSREREICAGIREICEQMAQAEHYGDDTARWPTLAAECIADLPAVEID